MSQCDLWHYNLWVLILHEWVKYVLCIVLPATVHLCMDVSVKTLQAQAQ